MMAMLCYTFLCFVSRDKNDEFSWVIVIMMELLLEAMIIPALIMEIVNAS